MNIITGRRLAQEHNISVAHALYRLSGDWYHVLKRFPGALFDGKGYIVFPSREAYDDLLRAFHSLGVKEKVETNTLTVKGGISKLPGYQFFGA